ncbi:MAG: phosphosulfolactate synthase [Deltaproteobacteria bacterium]|nr:phosphosulfolactate synthase [Deltaproteobacteria bacterium]
MGVKAFDGVFEMPMPGRTVKPRKEGITMIIDKGLGLAATQDLLDSAADVIDFIKLTFGTSAFLDIDYLAEKVDMVKDADIWICPGGTFLEVSVWQGSYQKYLKRCQDLGFNAIEVSDGTIEIDLKTRADCIKRAVDMGFLVVSEVGKKDPDEKVATAKLHEEIAADLKNGAFKVIVEAREAGKGVGIYDKDGKPKDDEIEAIIKGVNDLTKLEWEAPIKNQQQSLIMRFGPNVSLGNIPPEDILALEALRQGLRGDTLKKAFLANPTYKK